MNYFDNVNLSINFQEVLIIILLCILNVSVIISFLVRNYIHLL